MKALEVKDLSFGYEDSPILKDVTFSVEEGDFLAIIGPNGGGKTTLLKLLVGLLRPESGFVKIFGEMVPCRKVSVGYVPQNTNRNLEFPISVAQCVATGCRGLKANSDTVRSLLEKVGMEHAAERRLGGLSGGERQRALVARALAAQPRILFLDEPSSNMDAAGQAQLFELLGVLNREMTIVLVSHDLRALAQQVKSVACVNRSVHYHSGEGLSLNILHEAYGCEMELMAQNSSFLRLLHKHEH